MIDSRSNYSKISLYVIYISLIVFNFIFFPGNIISWDVFGYYLYLPLTFIYDNLGLQNVEIVDTIREQYKSSSTLYQAYETKTGSWVLKYPIGMSYLYFPFFTIGHLIAIVTNYPSDGFSFPYQLALLSGGILFSMIGFYFIRKILLNYFTDFVTACTLLIIYFGTNYFLHTSFHGTNAMSHNYLFTLYAVLIWATIKWYDRYSIKYLFLSSVTCGLIIISRQSEIVCLVIPLLWGTHNFSSLKERIVLLIKRKSEIFIFFGTMFIIAIPQLLYWKIITGSFLYYGYGNNPGEGLEFRTPFIKEVLFSFRKGWLIYTPVMIIALIGLALSVIKKSVWGIASLIYFIFNLYIVASWSNWWYAESFSQRALIPSYALLSLSFALSLQYILYSEKRVLRYVLGSFVIIFTCLNLFQTWQLLNDIIHPSRMTREAYVSVFLKTTKPDNFEELLLIDRDAENAQQIDENKYIKTKDWHLDFEDVSEKSSDFSYSNKYSFKADETIIYSPAIVKEYQEITEKDHAKLKVSMFIYATTELKENPGTLVMSFEHNGYAYGYKGLDIENFDIPLNDWLKIETTYITPVVRRKNDILKVYYWHRGKHPVYIDDLKVEVWEEK